VYSSEPLVTLDVCYSALQCTQSLGVIRGEKSLDQIFGTGINPLRENDLAFEDLFVDSERALIEERRVANEHFVDQNAKRPPVHRLTVPL